MAGRHIKVFAWAITRKQVEAQPKAPPGQAAPPSESMSFVTLEDETVLVETVLFPRVYRACGYLLERTLPLRFFLERLRRSGVR